MPSAHLMMVEDDLTLGELIKTVLERTGHGVTWFVRARLSNEGLVLMDADGVERLLQPAEHARSEKARTGNARTGNAGTENARAENAGTENAGTENARARYELALVDYRLKGSPIDGPDVTSHLVAAGIPVVGISGLAQLNQMLVRCGARGGIAKDDLFSRVLGGKLVINRDFAGDGA